MIDPDASPTYAEVYDAAHLAATRMSDLLQLAAQTRRAMRRATAPDDRDEEDVRIVRSRIARELVRRNDLRRRHPAPPVGSIIVVAEEPVDWPFAACEVAPRPGTTGTVVAYQASVTRRTQHIRKDRMARRFYVLVRMGDDFDHAPGSTLPVPIWQVRRSTDGDASA